VAVFLTHSHADHIAALAELKRELGAEAWSSELEPVRGTRCFRPGEIFNAGRHFIRTRLTPGHSPGGVTFIVEGHSVQAAMVGDAIFAGSIGGVRGDYAATLDTIRREILGLPGDTILCPGHGPLTTVAQELEHNPFFA
jgi:glyoxylase-like metal-dependent hydrolase (beta-lactamase superfamily II)